MSTITPVSSRIESGRQGQIAFFVLLLCLVDLALGCARVQAQTANAPSATQAAAIAVVNVTVIPMDRERVVTNQTVLVRGDRIAAMGTVSEVAILDGTLVIDGSAQYLLPGLTDAHVHLSTSLPWAPRADFGEGPLYLANGVTTVINLGG